MELALLARTSSVVTGFPKQSCSCFARNRRFTVGLMARGGHANKPLHKRPEDPFKHHGIKRERPTAKSTPGLNIDVPALFFGAIMIVCVVFPLAQWALGI